VQRFVTVKASVASGAAIRAYSNNAQEKSLEGAAPARPLEDPMSTVRACPLRGGEAVQYVDQMLFHP
jgi:hypothetical protein